MSFSFNFSAKTKAQAKTRVCEEMSKVVAHYGIEHARDLPAAIATGHAYIDVLADDEHKDISVMMSGSLSYQLAEEPVIAYAGINVSVGHVARAA